jgi:hypothetical protein
MFFPQGAGSLLNFYIGAEKMRDSGSKHTPNLIYSQLHKNNFDFYCYSQISLNFATFSKDLLGIFKLSFAPHSDDKR